MLADPFILERDGEGLDVGQRFERGADLLPGYFVGALTSTIVVEVPADRKVQIQVL